MKQRTFKRPEVLNEMITLRLQGWALEDLAFRYSCDKSSVLKACIRSGLPRHIILIPRPEIRFIPLRLNEKNERMNRGKTYREHLEEQRRKQLKVSYTRFII